MPKRKTIPKALRNKLLVDAMHRCCLCPEHHNVTDLHHVVWTKEDGPDTEDNLMVICPTCHAKIHRIRLDYTIIQLKMYKERWVRLCALGLPLDMRLAHALDYTKPPDQSSPSASTPLPPTPHLAHPYTMPKNWTGRRAEMDKLDEWLTADKPPMLCLIAYGGTGKTSLAWHWLHERVIPKQQELGLAGVFQWSFYEGEVSFQMFIAALRGYLGAATDIDPISAVIQRLQQAPVLLLLDGFERLLREYSSAEAAIVSERPLEEIEANQRRCADPGVSRFILALASDVAGKTLLTSRLLPEELDTKDGWTQIDLPGLDPGDGTNFLQANGIKGTDRELEDAGRVYGFHPLSLNRLVNAVHYDVDEPDDIRAAARYDVTGDLRARQSHILERAYNALPKVIGQFLSSLAALRGRPAMVAARFLAEGSTERMLSNILRRLEEDRWIQWKRGDGILDMHPLVRRYAYERLEDRTGTHARLAEHFQPLAEAVDVERAETIGDLAPVIDLYHHTVGAGRYDEAFKMFRDRLASPLYFRFGAYQTCIELLRALFPDGEDRPPRLHDEFDQAWTLNEIANSYSLSGQPRRAMALIQASTASDERRDDMRSLAIGLCNLAAMGQMPLGEMKGAASSLCGSVDVCREVGHRLQEAVDHLEIGRLLAYEGAFDTAQQGIPEYAVALFRELGQPSVEWLVWLYYAIRALLMGDAKTALLAARTSRKLAEEFAAKGHPVERSFVRSEWLIGWSLTALAGEDNNKRAKLLTEAEPHLTESLTRCRRINLVEMEPDILLAWARWHRVKDDPKQARDCADEALTIADRCEYRLKQADIHNFLAKLDLEADNKQAAITHAHIGYERAWCDGPPFCYKPALDEAERLLKELGAPLPRMGKE